MRRGARRDDWTTEDVRYLLEHAGVDPLREICRRLRRSREAVKQKAKQLRAQGYDVSLREYRPLTVICPKCSRARSRAGDWSGRTGFCEVCRMRDSYREAVWRQAEAYEALTQEQRALFDARENRTGTSAMPPRPREPATLGMPAARARRARELHAIDVERWEKECLKRLTDAAKSRTRRMREKSGTNPRKNRGDSVDARE